MPQTPEMFGVAVREFNTSVPMVFLDWLGNSYPIP